ncbi:MAG: hypothetical protein HEQ10_03440 [Dolichospermum sp. DEX182a]|nr:hypothetical protein [Dolichospermum sp. DEX182a]
MSALTKEQIKALNDEGRKLHFIDTDGEKHSVELTDIDCVTVLDEDLEDEDYTDAKLVGLWMKNDDYYEINMDDQYEARMGNQDLIWDMFQTM